MTTPPPSAAAGSDRAPPRAAAGWTPGAPTCDFLRLIPHEFARRHLVLSAGCREGSEVILASSSTRPTVLFNVGVRLGRPITTSAADPEVIATAIDRAYAAAQNTGPAATGAESAPVTVEGTTDLEADLEAAVREAEQDVLHTHGKPPAVRLVDLLLFEAVRREASDVHLQPLRDRTLVRYRLDGALHTVRELPASLAAALTSRIKVMARLDVAERRAPQDGRATVTVGRAGEGGQGRRVDLRVGTLPSTYGERVVIRILDAAHTARLLSFAGLGMPEPVERAYLAQVSRPSGIVLSTGPTGSGKTTTLYTTLAWISATNAGALARGCELNIMTVEDPVEYDLSGTPLMPVGPDTDAPQPINGRLSVSQTQVDPKKNVTFATGLRHILRQDPDVIMVGEIRDQETARIAVQASLTGHLVLSTLHTSDAASAVARLLDLGIEPFLVSSSLSAVLAQRLVRRVHRPCGGQGCGECLGTGYRGRTGVFELLIVDHAVRDLIDKRATAESVKTIAHRNGMVPLRDAGAQLVADGETTAQEVARVIEALDEDQP